VFLPLTKYFLIHYSYLHSILLLLSSPFLLLYFQRSNNDQITYLGFTFVLKKEKLFCYFVSSWKTILIINFGICCKSKVSFFLIRFSTYARTWSSSKFLSIAISCYYILVQIEQNDVKIKIPPRKQPFFFANNQRPLIIWFLCDWATVMTACFVAHSNRLSTLSLCLESLRSRTPSNLKLHHISKHLS
jgi:hypothetical protein